MIQKNLNGIGAQPTPQPERMKTKKWKPAEGETFYCVLMDTRPFVDSDKWVKDDKFSMSFFKHNNCFKTKKEALAKMRLIKKILNGRGYRI